MHKAGFNTLVNGEFFNKLAKGNGISDSNKIDGLRRRFRETYAAIAQLVQEGYDIWMKSLETQRNSLLGSVIDGLKSRGDREPEFKVEKWRPYKGLFLNARGIFPESQDTPDLAKFMHGRITELLSSDESRSMQLLLRYIKEKPSRDYFGLFSSLLPDQSLLPNPSLLSSDEKLQIRFLWRLIARIVSSGDTGIKSNLELKKLNVGAECDKMLKYVKKKAGI